MVESRSFFRRHRRRDRVFLEEREHALVVFQEQVCQIFGEALANHDAHHHRILTVGREREGGHLPTAGSQLVRKVKERVVRTGSILDEEADGPSLESSSEMYFATS